MELHLRKARRAMHAIEAVEQHVEKATNAMAELDWEQRNTEKVPLRSDGRDQAARYHHDPEEARR